jgi:hypothetical protein
VTEVIIQKKRSRTGAYVWSAVTAALLFRTFYRPARAVVNKGYATRCPGEGCKPGLAIEGPGAVTVYAVTSGRAAVSQGSVSIASDREPIVITYTGVGQVFVQTGEDIGMGQQLAVMNGVDFSVTEVFREPGGRVLFRPIEPASYLAARGLRISEKGAPASVLWCSHGRRITVPKAVLACGIRLPDPSSLMLLPVSVTTE